MRLCGSGTSKAVVMDKSHFYEELASDKIADALKPRKDGDYKGIKVLAELLADVKVGVNDVA
jgi:hypothetical protein